MKQTNMRMLALCAALCLCVATAAPAYAESTRQTPRTSFVETLLDIPVLGDILRFFSGEEPLSQAATAETATGETATRSGFTRCGFRRCRLAQRFLPAEKPQNIPQHRDVQQRFHKAGPWGLTGAFRIGGRCCCHTQAKRRTQCQHTHVCLLHVSVPLFYIFGCSVKSKKPGRAGFEPALLRLWCPMITLRSF